MPFLSLLAADDGSSVSNDSSSSASPSPSSVSSSSSSSMMYAILTFNPDFGYPLNRFDIDDAISRPSEWARIETRWRRMLQTYQGPTTLQLSPLLHSWSN